MGERASASLGVSGVLGAIVCSVALFVHRSGVGIIPPWVLAAPPVASHALSWMASEHCRHLHLFVRTDRFAKAMQLAESSSGSACSSDTRGSPCRGGIPQHEAVRIWFGGGEEERPRLPQNGSGNRSQV